MTEEQLKKFFSQSGEKLAELVLSGFVGKISDELAAVVSKAQRAQGEAETESARQHAEATKFERAAIAAAHELEQLKREKAELQPVVEALRKETAELKDIDAKLKEERLRAAGNALNILHGEHGG